MALGHCSGAERERDIHCLFLKILLFICDAMSDVYVEYLLVRGQK